MTTIGQRASTAGLLLLTLGACIPLPNDLGGDDITHSEGTTSPVPATTDLAESSTADSTADSTAGVEGSTGVATMTTSTTEVDPSSGDTATDGPIDEPTLDMGIPEPGGPPCDEVGPSTVLVTSNQTSMGALPIAHAVYGWDHCCFPRPRLVLTVDPAAPEGFLERMPPDYVGVIAIGFEEVVTDFEGSYTGAFQDAHQLSPAGPEGTFEVLAPLLSSYPEGVPDPAQRLQAHVTLNRGGWNFEVEVDAPYCSAYDLPSCPCE